MKVVSILLPTLAGLGLAVPGLVDVAAEGSAS